MDSKLDKTLEDLTFMAGNLESLDQTIISFEYESELGEVAAYS